MNSRRRRRHRRGGPTLLLVGGMVLLSARSGAQEASRATDSLYRIEVEDATEAALIEQELKVRPVLVRGRSFFYLAEPALNRRLEELGFKPERSEAAELSSRVVRVPRTRPEPRLRDLGARVILRERGYWIVRVTEAQLAALRRADFKDEPLRPGEPRPRQVRLLLRDTESIRERIAPRIDLYNVEATKEGYAVLGSAFDDALDHLRAQGFTIQVLPDPPGVKR